MAGVNLARQLRGPIENPFVPSLLPTSPEWTSDGWRRGWDSVSLLLKGVSIEIVSKLLGHSSIKVTERHYSPWVKARQDQLETEVRRIWTGRDLTTQ